MNLWYINDHLDTIGMCEHKYILKAAFEGDNDVIGYIEYTILDEELYVDYIFVKEEFRRIGISKYLYQKLKEENSNLVWMESGYMTDLGKLARKSFEKN